MPRLSESFFVRAVWAPLGCDTRTSNSIAVQSKDDGQVGLIVNGLATDRRDDGASRFPWSETAAPPFTTVVK